MLKNLILAAVVVTPTASGLLELLAVSPSGEDEIRGDPVAGSLVQTSENNAHVEGGGDQDKKTMLKASTNLFGRLRQPDGSYEELDATSLIPINIHEPSTSAAFVQVSRPGSIGADEEFGSQPREQKFGGGAASIFDWDPPVWVRHACFGALRADGGLAGHSATATPRKLTTSAGNVEDVPAKKPVPMVPASSRTTPRGPRTPRGPSRRHGLG